MTITVLILYTIVTALSMTLIYLGLRQWQTHTLQKSAKRWLVASKTDHQVVKPSTTTLASWLEHRSDAAQRAIERDLPNALDLLRVCIDAGLDLSAAMFRVSHELAESAPKLSKLLAEVQLRVNAGASRSAAYEAFAEEVGSREISNLMMSLAQAEQVGSSLSLVLRTYATELRSKRRLRAEELGAKLSTKLIFPLLICLFPAMLIVLAGPSLLSAVELIRLLR